VGRTAATGVLSCELAFTVALPMPNSEWSLQYCVPDNPSATADRARFRQAFPPHPTRQFDFRRAFAGSASSRTIILRAAITSDGSVQDVRIVPGPDSNLNALAADTFRRWRFRPALVEGQAVSVEVLLGIPAGATPQ
jgi:TonB family protein